MPPRIPPKMGVPVAARTSPVPPDVAVAPATLPLVWLDTVGVLALAEPELATLPVVWLETVGVLALAEPELATLPVVWLETVGVLALAEPELATLPVV